MGLVMFFILIIIGWTMYIVPALLVPNFLWVCYALAWAVWVFKFGYKWGKI